LSNHNDFQSDIVYSQIDSTGKIVLTKNMLEYYGFHAGDSVRIIYTEGAILVQKQPKKNQI
jgi:bifunctional DNA-binding transcriptional regulator/antitoxin component of YhaV-PrlF toxin-antitoxin module